MHRGPIPQPLDETSLISLGSSRRSRITGMVQTPRRLAMIVTTLVLAAVPACTQKPQQGGTPAAPAKPAGLEPGTPGWQITKPGEEHAIEGFADHSSALPGDPVRLFVSTKAANYTVTAYRMGAYTNSHARQVWKSSPQTGVAQPAPQVRQPTNTVVAGWRPSLTVNTKDWQPGNYLFRLDGDNGAQQYVPLTVRTPSNAGRVVLINGTTTWQAYNQYGGTSLYNGPNGYASRARAVSFDRPYQHKDTNGAGGFLIFEEPLLQVAERAGVPVGYATDEDLHANPHLLDGAKAVVTLGHDEYWSSAMRASTARARDRGTNVAILGGNEIYRHIRLDPTPLGPNRLEVDYKSFEEDPMSATNPREATPEWRQPPEQRPESTLTGNFYQCNGVTADLVTANADNWMLRGIVSNGQKLPGLVGDEYAKVDLNVPTARPMEVLFHSPLDCRAKPDTSDAVYFTSPSGAGIFSSGTMAWVCGLDPNCQGPVNGGEVGRVISAITTRVLREFAKGPAGFAHPAHDNLAAVGVDGAEPNPRPTFPPEPTEQGP
jgi:hypothetical protein